MRMISRKAAVGSALRHHTRYRMGDTCVKHHANTHSNMARSHAPVRPCAHAPSRSLLSALRRALSHALAYASRHAVRAPRTCVRMGANMRSWAGERALGQANTCSLWSGTFPSDPPRTGAPMTNFLVPRLLVRFIQYQIGGGVVLPLSYPLMISSIEFPLDTFLKPFSRL